MQSIQLRRRRFATAAALGVATLTVAACAMNPSTSTGASTPASPVVAATPAIVWGPAPAIFQPGAQMAVLKGDPSKSEAFTVRLRFPDGYKVAPHTHPTDEHVTVVDGQLMVGMGNTFDEAGTMTLQPGGTVTAQAMQPHYVKAIGATTVQVDAMGPFALTYVNPNDTPKATP